MIYEKDEIVMVCGPVLFDSATQEIIRRKYEGVYR